MSWDRKQRQEAILREKIAVIIIERLSDPRLGFVTITSVELSKDKKIAKVFYTVLGTDAQLRSTARALSDGRGRIQEQLAPTLRMRSMPELRFIFNEQVAKESRLLDLIQDVTSERVDRAGVEGELPEGFQSDGAPELLPDGSLEFPELDEDGKPVSDGWDYEPKPDDDALGPPGNGAVDEPSAHDKGSDEGGSEGDESPDAAR